MIAAFTLLLLLVACLVGWVLLLRWLDAIRAAGSVECYQLRFPREMTPTEVLTFVAGLGGLRPPVVWRWLRQPCIVVEAHAEPGRITHFIYVPKSAAELVLSGLRAAVPSIRLERTTSAPRLSDAMATELRLNTSRRSLRTDRTAEHSAAVLAGLLPLAGDERAVVQVVVSPLAVPRPLRLEKRTKHRASVGLFKDGYETVPHSEALRAMRDKQQEPLYGCSVRLAVSATTGVRRRSLLARLAASYAMLETPGVSIGRRAASRTLGRWVASRRVPLLVWPLVLNAAEVASVLGWPISATQLPGVDLGGCRQLPAAVDVPSEGYVIAEATYPGSERPVALAERDRDLHISITGPTGSGKSNLLANLITLDMQSGRGCIVVDVNGNLITECLKRVPKQRVEDVVLIDPSDAERPVGINLLATDYAPKELVADQVTQTFHLLFEAFWGPRSDDLLRAAALSLMRDPAMTLVELVPLLTNEAFRARFVRLVQDDQVGLAPFWSTFNALRPSEQVQVISPVMNKLRQILLRPMVMNCVGQSQPRLDLGQAVNGGKLVFIRLPEGLLGDEASSLLASLLVGRIWAIAQARVAQDFEQRRPTTLYLDEAHRMVGSAISLDNMLAQARATRLSLVLATQHLTQWQPTELRQAVLSNCRSKIAFQPTARDAQLYQAEFKPYLTAEDMQGLGRFEIVAQLATGQQVAPPLTARTLPPTEETGTEARCRAWSRSRYGRTRSDIEAELKARHAAAKPSAPIGRRKKGAT